MNLDSLFRFVCSRVLAGLVLVGLVSAEAIFDGQSLSGWSIQHNGRFSVRDGVIVLDRGAGWLRSDRTFADFTLTVELRFLDDGANSGLFVRTGPESRPDAKGYPKEGYQVQCENNVSGVNPPASIIPYGGPLRGKSFDREAIAAALRPTGEWNTIEVTCRGEVMVSRLNGVQVASAYGVGRREGHIGIQAEGGRLEFRSFELVEHPVSSLRADASELVFAGAAAQLIGPERVTLWNHSDQAIGPFVVNITGPQASAFRLAEPQSFKMPAKGTRELVFHLRTGPEETGVLHALAEIRDEAGTLVHVVGLQGLSTPGLEGKREPPLQDVLSALGHAVDVGWSSLAGNIQPEPMGAEVMARHFRAAGPGVVTMQPMARYSPDFLLPFGYYLPSEPMPDLHFVGTLARATETRPEHNILYPSLASGRVSFQPPAGPFGLFTASPSHLAYTDDALNARLEPNHAAHAVRVYPARDRVGQLMPNAYLVCFEEARNGDYQDYVFLVSNVVPEP